MIELTTKEELLSVLNSFSRKTAMMAGAYMDEHDEKIVFKKDSFKRSVLGVVNICKADEEWPHHEGVKLLPILQIRVIDLPFVSKELEGVTYITIFGHPHKLDLSQSEACCVLRVYYDEDLVFLEEPSDLEKQHHVRHRGDFIEFIVSEDYPHDYDLPGSITSAMEKHDLSVMCHYQYHGKFFGWPYWKQEVYMYNSFSFVFQFDGRCYGDHGCFYVFRNLETTQWRVLFQAED